MTQAQENRESQRLATGFARKNCGYSLIEALFTVMIGLILAAIAVPSVNSGLNLYRLSGAVNASTWAVQSTRYQALMAGYPYQVVFTAATNSYQIQDLPVGAATYANVGTSVPLSGSPTTLNQDTTLRFLPNGSVSAPVGALAFAITYKGSTKTITVTTYGNVKVTP